MEMEKVDIGRHRVNWSDIQMLMRREQDFENHSAKKAVRDHNNDPKNKAMQLQPVKESTFTVFGIDNGGRFSEKLTDVGQAESLWRMATKDSEFKAFGNAIAIRCSPHRAPNKLILSSDGKPGWEMSFDLGDGKKVLHDIHDIPDTLAHSLRSHFRPISKALD